MKKYIKIIGTLMVFSVLFVACQEDLEIGDAGAKTLSGDWVVSEYDLDMNNLYGPYTLQIYNTSMDEDSIWIDNIYDSGYKIKSGKLSETTFGATGMFDVTGEFENEIDISEAKVIDNDSIIFRVTLYNEDGTIYDDYYEAGTRYTGW
ncbi:lipid-binding protein [Saccharicrinis sp. GN24d3]|uniref:lipid-binding protein n=1 Tax=Saccharicrinis sp. GN24d3 TaxID=3458416 RepID=UPI004035ACEA